MRHKPCSSGPRHQEPVPIRARFQEFRGSLELRQTWSILEHGWSTLLPQEMRTDHSPCLPTMLPTQLNLLKKQKPATSQVPAPASVCLLCLSVQFSSVQLPSRVRLFATPSIAARQASLSITNSRSLLRLMPIDSVMPSSHLILFHLILIPSSSCLQSLPASGSFPVSQFFTWGGQSIGVSASASVLPMNTQDWSPLGWTGWIPLLSIFSSTLFHISCLPEAPWSPPSLSLSNLEICPLSCPAQALQDILI